MILASSACLANLFMYLAPIYMYMVLLRCTVIPWDAQYKPIPTHLMFLTCTQSNHSMQWFLAGTKKLKITHHTQHLHTARFILGCVCLLGNVTLVGLLLYALYASIGSLCQFTAHVSENVQHMYSQTLKNNNSVTVRTSLNSALLGDTYRCL